MKLPFKHIDKVTDVESDGGEQGNCADGMLMRGLSNLYSPESSVSCHTRDVADVLMEMGRLSAEQVEQIRSDCHAERTSDIEQFIISKSIVDKLEVLEARAKLCDLEFRRIEVCEVEEAAFERLDIVYIRSNHID